jgi:hypothetical protein
VGEAEGRHSFPSSSSLSSKQWGIEDEDDEEEGKKNAGLAAALARLKCDYRTRSRRGGLVGADHQWSPAAALLVSVMGSRRHLSGWLCIERGRSRSSRPGAHAKPVERTDATASNGRADATVTVAVITNGGLPGAGNHDHVLTGLIRRAWLLVKAVPDARQY